MSETTAANEPQTAEISLEDKAPQKFGFRFDAVTISVLLIAAAVAFIVWDFRDVIWMNQREKTARSYIQPGKRLTQVERELNAAGFQTLYSEDSLPSLQISLIDHQPLILSSASTLIAKLAPSSHISLNLGSLQGRYLRVEANARGVLPPNPVISSEEMLYI